MKIRTDFVTNSSSVSYLLTMKPDLVNLFDKHYKETRDPEKQKVLDLLRKKLLEDGTRVVLEGEEMYVKKIDFATDEVMDKESYDEDIDFEKIKEDELWTYILGEYVLKNEISSFKGLFGSTQIKTY